MHAAKYECSVYVEQVLARKNSLTLQIIIICNIYYKVLGANDKIKQI